MVVIKRLTNDELINCYEDEMSIIKDILPGNWEPNADEWLEIAREIIRAINRFRYLRGKKGRWVRFMREDEYVESFEKRGVSVPPFIVFQPYEVRDGVPGYLVPCREDDPNREWYEGREWGDIVEDEK